MAQKPCVALFEGPLQMSNPRGAGRLFRALAEELAHSDEFDCVVLRGRLSPCSESVFAVTPLAWWLHEHPVQIVSDRACRPDAEQELAPRFVPPRVSRRGSRMSRLFARLRPERVLAPQFLDRARRAYVAVRRSLSPAYWREWLNSQHCVTPGRVFRPGDRVEGPDRVMCLEQVDVLLNFWWFHCPENPLGAAVRSSRVRVLSWFLDALPLRAGHMDVDVGISCDGFKAEVNRNNALSDHVVAISESAREDLIRFFHVPPERTSVVPCGSHYALGNVPAPTPARLNRALEQLRLDPALPIVLCVGVNDGWKNTQNALRACRLLAERDDAPRFQLVLVGEISRPSYIAQYTHLARPLAEKIPVTFTGYLADEELEALQFASRALLYPSFWEGFGIPPLDAMACGVPVVTSDIGPMPDVCGPQALYCDPFDPESIAQALCRALNLSGQALVEYREQAARHAAQYSWGEAGRQLKDLIRQQAQVNAMEEFPSTVALRRAS